jgi:guanylate cyclase
VAGVIGRSKFIYDLWGDTVNTASRMESHGIPGAIQVTERAYIRLALAFEFEDRGVIEVKGKGPMHTYLLIGLKDRIPTSDRTKVLSDPRAVGQYDDG